MNPQSPLLFLVFNRPETTERVFATIRQARPTRLYIAGDGPRPDKEGEAELVRRVREIVTAVDWDCEVRTLFRDHNLGCKMAVSGAISWFFEQEEEGIILEDDCVPHHSFFPFCSELLQKYRHDTRVMAISGDNFQDGNQRTAHSYYFSRYFHCWGWASWRRAWSLYDGDMSSWPAFKSSDLLNDLANNEESFVNYWTNLFDSFKDGKIDTWDYPFLYACWVNSGLTILSNVNLVTNIGFDEVATHTKDKNCVLSSLPVQEIAFPLSHPPFMIRDALADAYTERNVFSITVPEQSFSCRMIEQIRMRLFR